MEFLKGVLEAVVGASISLSLEWLVLNKTFAGVIFAEAKEKFLSKK